MRTRARGRSSSAGRIAGIRPLSPGFATFSVRPQPAGLAWFTLTRPTVRGPIEVSWRDAGPGVLEVSVPPGTVAEVVVPGEPGRHRLTAGRHVLTRQTPVRA